MQIVFGGNMRLATGLLFFLLLAPASDAFADCVNPNGKTGTMIYNSSEGVFQGCVEGGWIAFHEKPVALESCPSAGLVAHWKLDEASGTTALNSAGAANGTLVNMDDSDWVFGKLGRALDFDGADDVVTSGLTGPNVVTVSAWINPRGWGESQMGRIAQSQTTFWIFYLFGNPGGVNPNSLAFWSGWGTREGSWSSPSASIELNQWQHVAVTYDGTAVNNDPKMYINSALQGLTEYANPEGAREAAGSVYLGNNSLGTRTFDGKIDDVRIYNRVLAYNEIVQLYNNGMGCQ